MSKLASTRRFGIFALVIAIHGVSGCATTTQKIYGDDLSGPRVHQVTEITYVASKEEVLAEPGLVRALNTAGIGSSEIQNGSVAVGRVYCCGGSIETYVNAVVYFPPGLEVAERDIVEFVVGAGASSPGQQSINTAVRVRHKDGVDSGECQWLPNNPALWMRVIHCPWMEQEGWVKGKGTHPEWYKPPAK